MTGSIIRAAGFTRLAEDIDVGEKQFVTITAPFITQRYQHLNQALFGGELPTENIVFKTMRSTRTIGKAVVNFVNDNNLRLPRSNAFISSFLKYDAKKVVSGYLVQISTNYKMTQEQFDGILAHEMIHVWCYANGYFTVGHGSVFLKKRDEVQAKASFHVPLKEDASELPDIANSGGRRLMALLWKSKEGKLGGVIYHPKLIPASREEGDTMAEKVGRRIMRTAEVRIYDTMSSLYLNMTVHTSMKVLHLYNIQSDEVVEIQSNGKEIGAWVRPATT